MSNTQSTDRKVTAPRDASPEIKALAQEVNVLARKVDSAVTRRDHAQARHDSIAADLKRYWLGGPNHLQIGQTLHNIDERTAGLPALINRVLELMGDFRHHVHETGTPVFVEHIDGDEL